jgi:hypothetical protein
MFFLGVICYCRLGDSQITHQPTAPHHHRRGRRHHAYNLSLSTSPKTPSQEYNNSISKMYLADLPAATTSS